MAPRKYDAKTIAFIKENFSSMTFSDMAKEIHSTVFSLKRMVSKLRADGHNIPRKSKSVLTDTQKRWIADNFNSVSIADMSVAMNLPGSLIKSWLHFQTRSGLLIRTNSFKNPKKTSSMPRLTNSVTPEGKEAHRNRKPPVSEVPSRNRPMDVRVPTRNISTEGLIKIYFHDKNKTIISARDEDHVARIRKTYAKFEDFGSHLVYP